jgi:hypothetical protein
MTSELQNRLGASKGATTLLVLFIPSVDRDSKPVDQDLWVAKALEMLGDCFGGATAFPQGKGVWKDDEKGGRLVYDEPVIINCYTLEELIEEHAEILRRFLTDMGQATNQGAVGMVIDRDYLEIGFPLEDANDG